MKIIESWPPNIKEIRAILPAIDFCEPIFPFGDTLYNPHKRKLLPDVLYHEEVHQKQQTLFTSPEIWWMKYLNDPEFRLAQEIEAYGEQYLFAKEHVKIGKLLDWAKENMARALSGEAYGNLLSYGQAESRIRNYGK